MTCAVCNLTLTSPTWPVLALSVAQSGMILLNFTIQLLILSRRLRSTSLCVARLLSSLCSIHKSLSKVGTHNKDTQCLHTKQY
jgi:hypothetical protein